MKGNSTRSPDKKQRWPSDAEAANNASSMRWYVHSMAWGRTQSLSCVWRYRKEQLLTEITASPDCHGSDYDYIRSWDFVLSNILHHVILLESISRYWESDCSILKLECACPFLDLNDFCYVVECSIFVFASWWTPCPWLQSCVYLGFYYRLQCTWLQVGD